MLPRSLWAMARSSTSFTPAGLIGLESHLLERVDAAVLACDLDGRILFANRYAVTRSSGGWRPTSSAWPSKLTPPSRS